MSRSTTPNSLSRNLSRRNPSENEILASISRNINREAEIAASINRNISRNMSQNMRQRRPSESEIPSPSPASPTPASPSPAASPSTSRSPHTSRTTSTSETEPTTPLSRTTSRRSTTPIVFSQSTARKKPPPVQKKLEFTLEELCHGCIKKIKISRDVINNAGFVTCQRLLREHQLRSQEIDRIVMMFYFVMTTGLLCKKRK